MAVEKITYPNKARGDLWRATEANHVKEVVNNNADELSGVKTTVQTMGDTLQTVAQQNTQNTATLNNLVNSTVRQIFLTQAQYDALVDAGTVEADVMYNIYE